MLPVFEGHIRECGYKGRGTVTLNNGKDLALRYSPDDGGKRIPKYGDPVRCTVFHSPEFGPVVVDWSFEGTNTGRSLFLFKHKELTIEDEKLSV